MDYSRFFKVFNRMPGRSEEVRRAIIRQFSDGRTDSLRNLSLWEYERMCSELERSFKDPRVDQRSKCLRLMQQLGIDTTDWRRINTFCRDKRIAGVEFAELKLSELMELEKKLRSIQRHGGLKPALQHNRTYAVEVITMKNNEIIN